MGLYEIANQIETQQDFNVFLKALKRDLKSNSQEWENDTLESFIEGLDGYCNDKPQEELSWRIFAELLLAAKVYE